MTDPSIMISLASVGRSPWILALGILAVLAISVAMGRSRKRSIFELPESETYRRLVKRTFLSLLAVFLLSVIFLEEAYIGAREKGDELMRASEYSRAAGAYELALEAAPENPLAWGAYAGALELSGKREAALGAYERAVELSPHAPGLLLEAGRLALSLDRPERALPLFERLSKLRPEDPGALKGKAASEIAMGKEAAARKTLNRLLTLHPEEEEALKLRERLER